MIETRRDGVERSDLKANKSREADLRDARLASGQNSLTTGGHSISDVERSELEGKQSREANLRDARLASGQDSLTTERSSISGVERSELEGKPKPRGRLARHAACLRARASHHGAKLYKRCGAKRHKKRKGRPATERPFLSRENSSNGALKRPSELSGEILLGSERQCQGISG